MNFRITKILFLFIIVIVLSSCQSTIRFASGNSEIKYDKVKKDHIKSKPENIDKDEIVIEAEKWIGVPYTYGGDDRNGIDCSAFVQNVYKAVGIELPRTSGEQYEITQQIDDNDRTVGDLIFYKNNGKISHVGIYIGDNTMIHASTSKGVSLQNLDDYYYKSRYIATGRITNP